MIDKKHIMPKIDDAISIVSLLISIGVIGAIIIDYGFVLDAYEMAFILSIYDIGWWVCFLSFIYRFIVHRKEIWKKSISLTIILGVILCVSSLPRFFNAPMDNAFFLFLWSFLKNKYFIVTIIGLLSLMDLSRWVVNFANKKTNPALLIVICFMLVIAFGALLLLLPRSTLEHIRLPIADALFISTSAVCVQLRPYLR